MSWDRAPERAPPFLQRVPLPPLSSAQVRRNLSLMRRHLVEGWYDSDLPPADPLDKPKPPNYAPEHRWDDAPPA